MSYDVRIGVKVEGMKKVTIMLPDEFVCCAITAVAIRIAGIATFTNCFDISSDVESQTVRIQKIDGDGRYELVDEEEHNGE